MQSLETYYPLDLEAMCVPLLLNVDCYFFLRGHTRRCLDSLTEGGVGNTPTKGAKMRSLAGEKVSAITMVCGLLKGDSA